MTRFVIELPVHADDQAAARDLADDVRHLVRIAQLKGKHPDVRLDGTIAVAQPGAQEAAA